MSNLLWSQRNKETVKDSTVVFFFLWLVTSLIVTHSMDVYKKQTKRGISPLSLSLWLIVS